MFNLIDKELTKVLDIHLALGSIYNCYGTVQYNFMLVNDVLYGFHNIGKLANA